MPDRRLRHRHSAPFDAELEESGGQICVFNPRFGSRYLPGNHQKLVVADDRIAIIGGADVDDTYMTDRGAQHWRDLLPSESKGPRQRCRAAISTPCSLRPTGKKPSSARCGAWWASSASGEARCSGSWSGDREPARRLRWRSVGRDSEATSRLDMIFAYFAPPGALLRRIGWPVRAIGDGRGSSPPKGRTITRRSQQQQHNLRVSSAAAIANVQVSTGETAHQARHRRRCRPHRLGELRFPQPLYLNLEIMLRIKDAGFAAAMRRCFERELADGKMDFAPALHRRRANLWRRLKWAISTFAGDDDGLHRHAPPELPRESNALWWRRSDRPRTRSRAAR